MIPPTFIERLTSVAGSFIIGVCGDSGTGKSTLTDGIVKLLGDDLVTTFTLDDYHTEDREARKKSGRLPLDPGVNDLELLAEHLQSLRNGHEVVKPVYDHSTGTFAPQEVFFPKKVIIVEGLHPFYTEELRRLIDFKIYVAPDRDVKWAWKIRRDVEVRGHDIEDVRREILRRDPLFAQFIDIQKVHAEVVIKIEPTRIPQDDGENYSVRLLQQVFPEVKSDISLDFDMDTFMNVSARAFTLGFRQDHYYGRRMGVMTMDGQIHHTALKGLEESILARVGACDATIFGPDVDYSNAIDIAKLVICLRFLEKLDIILGDLEKTTPPEGEDAPSDCSPRS